MTSTRATAFPSKMVLAAAVCIAGLGCSRQGQPSHNGSVDASAAKQPAPVDGAARENLEAGIESDNTPYSLGDLVGSFLVLRAFAKLDGRVLNVMSAVQLALVEIQCGCDLGVIQESLDETFSQDTQNLSRALSTSIRKHVSLSDQPDVVDVRLLTTTVYISYEGSAANSAADSYAHSYDECSKLIGDPESASGPGLAPKHGDRTIHVVHCLPKYSSSSRLHATIWLHLAVTTVKGLAQPESAKRQVSVDLRRVDLEVDSTGKWQLLPESPQ